MFLRLFCSRRQIFRLSQSRRDESWTELQAEVRVPVSLGRGHDGGRIPELERQPLARVGRLLALPRRASNPLPRLPHVRKRSQASQGTVELLPIIDP